MINARSQRGFTLIEMMVVVAIIAILAGLLVSASSRPIGANARTVSQQIVTQINMARLRAQATRRIHRVIVTSQSSTVWVSAGANDTGLVLPTTPTWDMVQTSSIPKRVTVWDAQNAVYATAGAATVPGVATTGLNYSIDIRPDGQTTPTTLFITDGKEPIRVVVYRITGAAYARPTW